MKRELFSLEEAIQQWTKKLRKYDAYEDGQIYEMEDHLRSEIQQLQNQSYTEEEAFKKAIETFGNPEAINHELSKFKTRSILFFYLPSSIKIAWRKIRKNSSLNIVNILSLSLGLAISLFIGLFIRYEFSYDRFHEKGDRIYRLELDLFQSGQWIPSSTNSWYAGEVLRQNIGEIASMVSIMRGEARFSVDEKSFLEQQVGLVSNSFFEVFSAQFISGNKEQALKEPYQIVINEKVAKKYFGNSEAIGKQLFLESYQQLFTVVGVIKSIPANSHFNFDLFISIEGIRSRMNEQFFTNPGWTSCFNYLLLKEGNDIASVEAQFDQLVNSHFADFNTENLRLRTRPLFDIHFQAQSGEELGYNRDFSQIKILAYIGLTILLLSLLNYLNLSTARYHERIQEIGLRKVFGARKQNISIQFLGESLLYTFLAFTLAGLWVIIGHPFVEYLVGEAVVIQFAWMEMGFILLSWLIISLLISLHPSILLPSVNIIPALAKRFGKHSSSYFRRVLVFFQFTLTLSLLVGLGILSKQVSYLKNADPGYQTSGIFYFQNRGLSTEKLATLLQELKQVKEVQQVGMSSIQMPGPLQSSTFYKADSVVDSPDNVIKAVYVDDQFFQTFGLQLVDGNYFDAKKGLGQIILNESAVKKMGWKQAIDKSFHPKLLEAPGSVVGVAKDFNFEALYNEIIPVAFIYQPDFTNWIYINYAGYLPTLLSDVKDISDRFYDHPQFESFLIDKALSDQYQKDQVLLNLAGLFTFLSLLIAGLGIFGIAFFIAQQKTKEIAIRKVIGASVGQLFWFLTNDLLGLLIIASLLAVPISYYLSNQWLMDFPYHVDIDVKIFFGAFIFMLLLGLIASGIVVMKAAIQNPTRSLRYE